MEKIEKTINLSLVGLDGNAFSLMGAFQRQARKEGWTSDEINQVMDECQSGDYNHLLSTLMDYCNPDEDEQEWEGDEDDWEDN